MCFPARDAGFSPRSHPEHCQHQDFVSSDRHHALRNFPVNGAARSDASVKKPTIPAWAPSVVPFAQPVRTVQNSRFVRAGIRQTPLRDGASRGGAGRCRSHSGCTSRRPCLRPCPDVHPQFFTAEGETSRKVVRQRDRRDRRDRASRRDSSPRRKPPGRAPQQDPCRGTPESKGARGIKAPHSDNTVIFYGYLPVRN
jgi:hypothetical protein